MYRSNGGDGTVSPVAASSPVVMLLANNIRLVMPSESSYARSHRQSYRGWLPGQGARRAVMRAMSDARIATRCGVMRGLRETASATTPLRVRSPKSMPAQGQSIILRPYPQMMVSEQEQVVTLLKQACAVR
jgi:hypothetical protein